MTISLDELARQITELRQRLEALEKGKHLDVPRPVSTETTVSGPDLERSALASIRPLLFRNRPENERPRVGMYTYIDLRTSESGGISITTGGVETPASLAENDDIVIANTFNGMGNEQRVRIVKALLFGEKTAKELMLELTLTSSQLYHHLRELAKGGYLAATGRNIYALSQKGQGIASFMLCYINAKGHTGQVLSDGDIVDAQ